MALDVAAPTFWRAHCSYNLFLGAVAPVLAQRPDLLHL